MPVETLDTDLERRKHVSLRLRADLKIDTQKYEGRTYYVLKDPISLRYYWFSEQEHFLLRYLDGQHTLDEAQKEFEQQFRPERLTLEELEAFGQQLLMAGLAHNESPQAGQLLFERRKKRRRRELIQSWTNVLYIKIPLIDPDRLLFRMLPYLRWIFTTWFFTVSVLFMLSAILLVATHFGIFMDRFPTANSIFRFQTVVYLWLALAIVKVIHEFGHGLSCKAFGGEVHEMGALLLCMSPALYCNVSDAWTLADKWKRIIISFAGIYVELVIASFATFLWWYTPSQPFVNNLSLSMMVVCSISTVVLNGNPLMRFDGYYVLADWLEIPNLREQANRYVKNLFLEHCLGVEVRPEPYMEPGRRVLFMTYAVVSYVYQWVITFTILWFFHRLLKPYRLETLASLLTIAAAGFMFGWPMYNLGKSIHQRGRLPDMKPIRVTITGCILAAVLLVFLFVPLPVGRIRQTALVQVQPEAVEKVFVPVPGILDKVYVRDGQVVAKNDQLAVFSSLEIENQLADAQTQYAVAVVQIQALRVKAAETPDPQERAKVNVELSAAEGDCQHYEDQVKLYNKATQRLVLLAPPGVVMGLPHKDEVGKLWEKEQESPFCTIGDPEHLRALMPLSPADFRLLKDDLAAARSHGSELAVTIRVQGREDDTWRGQVGSLPESEAREVPLALTLKAGGPLAVQQGPKPNVFVPQSQQFLVPINFLSTDRAICPGTLANVKVQCRWHSGAWWVWRTVSSTFDLGLI